MVEYLNLFECANETYKIKKPIRLIELFAGIGSQAKALERLKINFEHYKICEFDKYAVTAYNAIHGTNFEPRDITKIHGSDLEIKDTDKFCYIMTYSFPCQDLSLAGKMKGMKKGEGTRSGLLWEVERLLKELREREQELPQVLLMENVPQVISKKNIDDFNKWLDFLNSLGYSSVYEVLNAKDYGIPQNRRRCFMVSILGNENYVFPKGEPLKLKLKDLLDKEVDEKYYLSEKMMNYICADNNNYLGNKKAIINRDIACTKTTRETNTRCDTSDYICDELPENFDLKCIKVGDLKGGKWDKINESCRRVYSEEGLCPTITAMCGGNQEPKVSIVDDRFQNSRNARIYENYSPCIRAESSDLKVVIEDKLLIKEATIKGYKEATEGDGVYINRLESKRGTVQKEIIQTIKTAPNDIGVVVSQPICLNSKGGRKGVEGLQPSVQDRIYSEDGIATAVTTSFMPSYLSNLRIRKLTPLECWRLMGFDDEDFFKAKGSLNNTYYNGRDKSNSRLYKMAGNSIVVNVLEAIFKKML